MERWDGMANRHAVPQVWNGVWNEMFKSTCSIPKRFDSWPYFSSRKRTYIAQKSSGPTVVGSQALESLHQVVLLAIHISFRALKPPGFPIAVPEL